ncbi:MAG: MMPL family transporter [Phycisphaerae bacterium]
MLDSPPLSDVAMDSCASVLGRIEGWAGEHISGEVAVFATGLTPYILDIKSVADADEVRVTTLVIAVIFLIVAILVRCVSGDRDDCGNAACVFVTLGVTEWFFVAVMGEQGIDWKVKLFAFVILVAVGQDYNIFLVTASFRKTSPTSCRSPSRRPSHPPVGSSAVAGDHGRDTRVIGGDRSAFLSGVGHGLRLGRARRYVSGQTDPRASRASCDPRSSPTQPRKLRNFARAVHVLTR